MKDFDPKNTLLKTSRLTLRNFRLDDLDDFYEYAKVKGVGERAGWYHHKSIDESLKILNVFIEANNILAIEYNNKVIGSIGIRNIVYEQYNGFELGYVISKDFQNMGFATEASRAVIDFLLNNLEPDFISIGHAEYNVESKRVIEKLGFTLIKTYKKFHETMNIECLSYYYLIINSKQKY